MGFPVVYIVMFTGLPGHGFLWSGLVEAGYFLYFVLGRFLCLARVL